MGCTWLVPAFLLIWVCVPDAAEACRCAPRSARCGPPAEFWKAAAVFSGQVTSIDRMGGSGSSSRRRIRVRVQERFRGSITTAHGELELFTGAVCGYPFKVEREYLVYAGFHEDGRLTASVCSRTTLLERAVDDLTYARQVTSGVVPQARILGEVRQTAEYGSTLRALSGIPVVLARQNARFTTLTDDRGRYAFDVPGTGTFVLMTQLPDTLYSSQPERRIEVADTRTCVEVNIDVRFNGHVAGRVVDGTGLGVAGLTVSHAFVSPRRGAPPPSIRTLTRDDGSFRLERLPPGPFVVSVELLNDDAGASSVEDLGLASAATRGVLRGGERLSLEPLRLPPTLSLVRLHGSVHTTDGAPAAGARVFLKDDLEGGHIVGEPAIADSLGRFVLAVLEGERYVVFAEGRVEHAAQANPAFSLPVVVNALAGMPPLRLTLRRGL